MLLEVIEDRHGRRSTIVTSQLPVIKWHELFGEQTIADAVLDRIVHTAHRLELKGESMRKKKSSIKQKKPSILTKLVAPLWAVPSITFASYYEAKQHIENYMHWYNYTRRHGALQGLTPMQKWEQGWAWLILKQRIFSASRGLSRPDSGALSAASAPYSLDNTVETEYLGLTGNQATEMNQELVVATRL